jgi:DNA repair protein RadC
MTKIGKRPKSGITETDTLSLKGLLAIVLDDCDGAGEQDAEWVLQHFHGLEGLLHADEESLATCAGISEGTSRRLCAAVELARRITSLPPPKRDAIRNADDAIHLITDMADMTQEQVRVILLDTGQRVVAIQTLYVGTSSAAVVRTAEVYREAILRNSPALILAHNHPSGDPTPSPEDVEFTRALYSASRILDIALVDHLIIGRDGWRSLKALGFIPL